MAAPPDSETCAYQDFIREQTRLLSPPLLPEFRLHLADDSTRLWQLTEDQLSHHVSAPPFWAFAWAGGQALARYILDTEDFSGQVVADFGCGCGVTTIAALKKAARCVHAIDVDPLCAAALAMNTQANGQDAARARFFQAFVDQPPFANAAELATCDIILAGDVFYERKASEQILAASLDFVANGQRVIVGDPDRQYFPCTVFKCLAHYQVPVDPDLEGVNQRNASVWELKPR